MSSVPRLCSEGWWSFVSLAPGALFAIRMRAHAACGVRPPSQGSHLSLHGRHHPRLEPRTPQTPRTPSAPIFCIPAILPRDERRLAVSSTLYVSKYKMQ
eukprot:scaffold3265_cov117-Isochrysis_galbana.AAC.3